MKSIIAFALIALVSVQAMPRLQHADTVAGIQAHMNSLSELLQTNFVPQADAEPSPACAAALQSLMTDADFVPCQAQMAAVMPMMSGCVNTTVLTSYCQGGCPAKAIAGINSIMTACADTIEGASLAMVSQYTAIAELPCIQLNGEYCFPKMIGAMAAFNGGVAPGCGPQPQQPSDQPQQPASGAPQSAPTSTESSNSGGDADFDLPVTNEQIAAACSPCTRAILNKIGQFFPDANFNMFDLMCMKDGDKWCYTEIRAVQVALNNAEDMNTTTADQKAAQAAAFNNAWAQQCGTMCTGMYYGFMVNTQRAEIQRAIAAGEDVPDGAMEEIDQMSRRMAGMCSKGPDGKFYFPKFMSDEAGPAMNEVCPEVMNATAACPAACKTAITGFITRLGCCAAERIPAAEDPAGLTAWLSGPCQIPTAQLAMCPRPVRKAAGRLALANLRIDWVKAHRAEFDIAFKADVARAMGVSPDDITILDVVSTGNLTSSAKRVTVFAATSSSGIYVMFQVSASNDAQVDALQAALLANINSNSITLDAVGSLPADAKVNAAGTVSVDTTKSTAATCDNASQCEDVTSLDGGADDDDDGGAAAGLAPTALFAALAAMLVAALRQ